MTPDRRRSGRIAYRDGVLPPAALVMPGRPVVVVNLSAGGLLLETGWHIRPGRLVEVRLQFLSSPLTVCADVLRAWVSALDRQRGLRYRAALAFTAPIAVPVPVDHLEGYRVPAAGAAPDRSAGTRYPPHPRRAGSASNESRISAQSRTVRLASELT